MKTKIYFEIWTKILTCKSSVHICTLHINWLQTFYHKNYNNDCFVYLTVNKYFHHVIIFPIFVCTNLYYVLLICTNLENLPVLLHIINICMNNSYFFAFYMFCGNPHFIEKACLFKSSKDNEKFYKKIPNCLTVRSCKFLPGL